MMIGAIVVPSRAKKMKRPRCSASPSVSWAISVCEPDQPNDSAAPLTLCSSSNGQKRSTSGTTAVRPPLAAGKLLGAGSRMTDAPAGPLGRRPLIAMAQRLEWLTIGWLLIEAAVAPEAGIAAHSLTLMAFGADNLIELASAFVLI